MNDFFDITRFMFLVATNNNTLGEYMVTSKSFKETRVKKGKGTVSRFEYPKTLDDWDFPKVGELIGVYRLVTGPFSPNLYIVGKIVQMIIRPPKNEKGITKKKKSKGVSVDRLQYDIEVVAAYDTVKYPIGEILPDISGLYVRVTKIN